MRKICLSALITIALLGSSLSSIASAGTLSIEDGARAFGAFPKVWGLRLSPDGQRVSVLTRHGSGVPIAMVVDLQGGKPKMVLASDKGKMNIQWCDWANDSRLLCGFFGVKHVRSYLVAATRLVAVDADGSDMQVLAQRQQRDQWSFHQDEIVDWLPDDREHILMELREGGGEGVSRINIYSNRTKTVKRARVNVWDWRSDGHGTLRVRQEINERMAQWRYTTGGDSTWKKLHRYDTSDHKEVFEPMGFGEDPNKLMIWEKHEGRVALFGISLDESLDRELIYSHPEVDLDGVAKIGKHNRLIGVSYSTDAPQIEYIDETIKRIDSNVHAVLPGLIIRFVGESWDRRYYLIHVSSDVEAGTYYRFDSKTNELDKITDAYPRLQDVTLAEMTPVRYPSDDGVMIPSYVTLPSDGSDGPRPTIILPHGGPRSRDEWGFNWLTQFLAARGYVVLQSNYRGSGGYGDEWAGDGAFRNWKRAMTDLEYGARHLVESGITDPDRLCALGWSYGGYAALMSAIEFPERYRCVVSIAGVSDPIMLVSDSWGIGKKYRKSQISQDPEDVRQGSPKRRAKEINVPVLLVHGEDDLNVPIKHSEQMAKSLRRKKKSVDFIEYEGVEHSILDQDHRIDMLQKIGAFLDTNLQSRNQDSSTSPSH